MSGNINVGAGLVPGIWATTRVAPTGIFLEQGIFFRARNKIFFQWRLAKHPNEFCRGRSCACPYNLNFF